MIVNDELEGKKKEAFVASHKVLPLYLPEGTEKNNNNSVWTKNETCDLTLVEEC
jgi:hypothetical protein